MGLFNRKKKLKDFGYQKHHIYYFDDSLMIDNNKIDYNNIINAYEQYELVDQIETTNYDFSTYLVNNEIYQDIYQDAGLAHEYAQNDSYYNEIHYVYHVYLVIETNSGNKSFVYGKFLGDDEDIIMECCNYVSNIAHDLMMKVYEYQTMIEYQNQPKKDFYQETLNKYEIDTPIKEGNDIILSYGNFREEYDLPMGVYDVHYISGHGSFSYRYRIDEGFSERELLIRNTSQVYRNFEITKDMLIIMYGDLVVKLVPVK